MKQQTILFTDNIGQTLEQGLSGFSYDKLYILTDKHTLDACYPVLANLDRLSGAKMITIEAGDTHKNLAALAAVWQVLSEDGATRRSLLLNLGGGMVTDLGGFAASTFKRGIAYINIPTTLLGAVDAAVGGKTGINFNGLKNEVGVFNPADAVIVSSQFFGTLDYENRLSGYAEMLKHGLISSESEYDALLSIDMKQPDAGDLLALVAASVKIKEAVVAADPYEQNLRKALNLGHTFGHAFESLSHERNAPVAHGYAVAWGLTCELLLSHLRLKFPMERIYQLVSYISTHYGVFYIICKDYPRLIELMRHDKKNESDAINFTLLSTIGEPVINQTAGKEDIEIVLDLYRDLFKI